MKHIILSYLCLALSGAYGQTLERYNDLLKQNQITLHTDDGYKILFEVEDGKRKPSLYHTYYWYTSQKIHHSQGDYSGKVLHGFYHKFFPSNNLAEKGQFKNGLKSGRWTVWYNNGTMAKQSKWKKGVESGDYLVQDSLGYLVEQGAYRDGKRDGKIFLYNEPDSTYVTKYFDRGIETTKEHYVAKQGVLKRTGYYITKQWSKLFKKEE